MLGNWLLEDNKGYVYVCKFHWIQKQHCDVHSQFKPKNYI